MTPTSTRAAAITASTSSALTGSAGVADVRGEPVAGEEVRDSDAAATLRA
jgi:hypothetical protein